MHWLATFLGIHDEAGPWYAFWSGFGGSVPDLAIVTGACAWWWHRTCHVHKCWRIGRHPVDGTPYKACRRHHPLAGKLTHADLLAAHERGTRP